MKELAILLAAGSIAWGALWFFFKLWLLGKGLTWLGQSLQLQAYALEEREQRQAQRLAQSDNVWGMAEQPLSIPRSDWEVSSNTKPRHKPFTVIKGGKR